MSQAIPRTRPPKRRSRDVLGPFEQAGEQLLFWWEVLRNIPLTIRHYSKQIATILAELSLGTGVFVIGGGVVGVVILLSTLTGSEVGFEGHNGLSVIGLAPLTGFISAYLNTREMAPIIAALGFAARIGCGFTSRLGAMRISEEIDALEAMAIRPVPYLVTTRLIAGAFLVLPLYVIGLVGTYVATNLMVTVFFDESHGTYQHYFQAFVSPIDVLYSAIKVVVMTSVVTLIHCYYGFTASGGPEGVGKATGRAIRASIIAITVLDITMTLTLWGVDQQAVISGVSPHRIRMLLVFGTVTALFGAYAVWTGLSYLGKVGGGVRMTAFLPTSGDSLGPASNVKYHGLVVGRVVTISGEAGKSRAQIVLKPEQAKQIPANVTARVLPATIFGSEYVDLVAPRNPEARRLPSVRTIPADRSAETLRIMDAVAAGERILRAVDPSQLDATTSALADMLDDNGENIGRFIERASTYLGTMLGHSDAFYRDLRLLGNVTQGAADAEPHLVAALRNSHSTLRLVVDQRRALDQLIAGTTGLSSETTSFLTANERNLVGTVYAGEPIVHIYNGRRDKLAQLLQAVPKVLSNGAHGVKDGKIVMEGLMQFPFEFGKPYNSGDCPRYVGATGTNCKSGGSYHSPYRGHP